jgi:hypothetical protein
MMTGRFLSLVGDILGVSTVVYSWLSVLVTKLSAMRQ